ncbi:MarR family winged helix-turn-helix transcriptional regulator [Leucobacter sp. M11]|uniref:MarR family winged helix-turn-helix transcriptional regulator n=1 Tax=Leucobacter sp. M11 TaxID=2993565 RepID=UPI002D7FBA7E|nr:MarR family transcriptional regulator [Leucobacter sp. M11]MEB4613741.1 MarR family transcriptional regulator [Leucobacter sp. M11]
MKMLNYQREVLLQLRALGTEMALFNRHVAASIGIKEIDLAVLDVLTAAGPLSPTQLSARTRIHAATMTGILTRLENDGWIERQPIPGDRRAIQIVPVNPQRFDAVFAEVNLRILDVFSTLNEQESGRLCELLAGISRSVREFKE